MSVDLDTRIRAYLAAMPAAISGSNGHGATFEAAKAVVLGFGLSIDQAWPYLKEYNQRCEPPWSDHELEHKLIDADANKKGLVRGYLLNGVAPELSATPSTRPAQRQEFTKEEKIQNALDWLGGFSTDACDLWHASQVYPGEDKRLDAIPYLQTYRPDNLININARYIMRSQKDGSEKAELCGPGETKSAAEWIEWITAHGPPKGRAGTWVRINPLRSLRGNTPSGAHRDDDVLFFERILLESDILPFDVALSLYAKVDLPVVAIIDSTGRGPHAHVLIQSADAQDYADKVRLIFDILEPLGIDRGNGNPSRYSRLPGASRIIGARPDASIQELLYLAPEPRTGGIFS